MKSIRHPRTARDPLLRVLTDGCVVDIEVGLTDADDHHVTRVDVLPEGESRGGDGAGHIWYQDGARIVRLHPGETAPQPAPPAPEEANDGRARRIKFTIMGDGESLADIEFAVLEALERIKDGNLLGFDRNETGSFHFEVEGREEDREEELPTQETAKTILVRDADREAVERAMVETGKPYPGLRTTHPTGMWVADGVRGVVLEAALAAGAIRIDND